jgi:hypothetical protein
MGQPEGHEFEDGDLLDVVLRRDDGTEHAARVDYGGLMIYHGKPALIAYDHRPDLTCHWIPMADVVDMTAVQPRRARRDEELETGTR